MKKTLSQIRQAKIQQFNLIQFITCSDIDCNWYCSTHRHTFTYFIDNISVMTIKKKLQKISRKLWRIFKKWIFIDFKLFV